MARLLPLLALASLACLLALAAAAPATNTAVVRAEDDDHAGHDHGDEVDHSSHSEEEHAEFLAEEEAAAKAAAEEEAGEEDHDGHDHGDEDAETKEGEEEDHDDHDHDGDGVADHDAEDHDDETDGAATTTAATTTVTDDADEDDDDDDNNTCFPGDATVTLASGAAARMDALSVGDVVHVGAGVFSPVFMFTHKSADTSAASYVRLTTASGASLTATASHYVHANGGLVAAGSVRVGDAMVSAATGGADAVVSVSRVPAAGLYNPQTLHGDVAVGGLVASAYTRAVAPAAAHAALAPARAAWGVFGWSSPVFEGGSRLAGLLPAQSVVA